MPHWCMLWLFRESILFSWFSFYYIHFSSNDVISMLGVYTLIYHITKVLVFQTCSCWYVFPSSQQQCSLDPLQQDVFIHWWSKESMMHGISILIVRWNNSKLTYNLHTFRWDNIDQIINKTDPGIPKKIILEFSFSLRCCHGIGALLFKLLKRTIEF